MSDLNENERKVLAKILRLAGDQFSNHGCNDYPLPDTPENRNLMRLVMKARGDDFGDDEIEPHGGQLYFGDDELMDYFADRLDPDPLARG